MAIEKFCTKCGKKFVAVGREVICPACKEQAIEDAKRAAVLKAKRASWLGKSVPVRISGRASTIIRRYGAANGLTFAVALDDLIKSSDYFKGVGVAWEEVEPYKSHRRDKHATDGEQEVKQDKLEKPIEAPSTPSKPVAQVAKATVKGTVKKVIRKPSKASKEVKKA